MSEANKWLSITSRKALHCIYRPAPPLFRELYRNHFIKWKCFVSHHHSDTNNSLFIKIKLWTKIEKLITKLIYNDLTAIAKEIKETNRYTNLAILAFEQQVQTVTVHAPHLYVHYFQFRL